MQAPGPEPRELVDACKGARRSTFGGDCALFEAAQGPRVLPGTYTVKMTKGDNVYTEQLNVALDPRAKFSLDERKAQLDLSMKIYHTIEHMTWAVEAIEGVRDGANERAGKVAEKDALRKQLQDLAASCEALVGQKIVATKEGGMITGEERIRELLGQLYGAVSGYEGRPTDYQGARAQSLAHELEDVIGDFQKLTQNELAGVNAGLKKKKAEAISVLTEAEWQKKRAAEGGSGAGAGMRFFAQQVRDRD